MDHPFLQLGENDWGLIIQKDHAKHDSPSHAAFDQRWLCCYYFQQLRRFKLDNEVSAEFAVEEISKSTIDKEFQRNPAVFNRAAGTITPPLQSREDKSRLLRWLRLKAEGARARQGQILKSVPEDQDQDQIRIQDRGRISNPSPKNLLPSESVSFDRNPSSPQ